MSSNNRVYTLATVASGSVLVPDLTAPFGASASLVNHTKLTNISTNTHLQIDAFISSKGAVGGLATLDGSGYMPSVQLGNVVVPATQLSNMVKLMTKGQLLMGTGTVATTLDVGSDSQVLVANSTQTNGVKWVPPLSPSAVSATTLGVVYRQTPDVSSNMMTYGYATSGQGWAGANQHSVALGTHMMENTPSTSTWCNTAVGATVLYNQTNGTENTAVGNSAGSTIMTGHHCVFIGCNTDTTVASGVHRIAIGASVSASNDYQFAIDPMIQEIKAPGLGSAGDANGKLLVIDLSGVVHKVNGLSTTVDSIDSQFSRLTEQVTAITPQGKGELVTSDGSSAAKISAGVDGQSLVADSTQANGIKWGQVDHMTLSNIGTNMHAQIDTFIASKGATGSLATLDGTYNILSSQLGNVGSTAAVSSLSTNMNMMLTFFRPWLESNWSVDLNAVKSAAGATQIPVYEAAINRGSNKTYFVNVTAASQPTVLEITFQCTCSVSLVVDVGNSAFVPVAVVASTYTDQWSQGNSLTLGSATSVLRFYLSIGFPSGPMAYPAGSPFRVGYTLDNSPYLANGSTVQIQGWH